jgi:membrane protein required for colicin V production
VPLAALATPDLVVLAVCALFALRGAWKGFAWQAVRTIGLVLALFVAGWGHVRFGVWLGAHVGLLPDGAAPWVAWFGLLAGVFLVATFFAWMARGAVRSVKLGGLDRLLGFAMGALMGLVLVTVVFLLWGSWVPRERLESVRRDSVTIPWMAKVVEVAEPWVPEDVRLHWGPVMHALDEEPATGGGA